jgi:HSP20 family protein
MANVSERTTTRPLARREPGSQPRPFETGSIFSPFALLRDMTDWMDQVFEGGDAPIRRGERMWAPAVEVRERDSALVVSADLPGIDQKDVKVEVDNNMLVIQGERKREEEKTEGGFRRSERFYGTFYRAIPLPENAKPDQAKADFRNGVLEVTIPVEQSQSQRRQIPVSGQPQK